LGLGDFSNFNERTGYVGILPLMFAVYAVFARRCRFTSFFSLAAVLSLLVVYGVRPLPAILGKLPVLSDICHTRLLLVVGFSLAVLAGFGLDKFIQNPVRRKTLLIFGGFWLVVGAVTLMIWHLAGQRMSDLDVSRRSFLLRQFLIPGGGFIAAMIVISWPAGKKRSVPTALCFGWTAFDLLWFGMGYNPAIPHDRYYPVTPAIEWLEKDHSLFRVFGAAALLPNTAEVYGLYDARGCDFMTVRRYEELIRGKSGDFWFYIYPTTSIMPEAFRLLNVKYVLLSRPLAVPPSGCELVYANGMAIYRYKAFEDRAFAVFDYQVSEPASILANVRSGGFDPKRVLLLEEKPKALVPRKISNAPVETNAAVRITSYEADEVNIEASLPQPGFLLLLDTYSPGWTAAVNDQPAPIYRADYNFRAVSLPSGKSTIRFTYQPGSLCKGMAISVTSLLVLGGAWFWSRKRQPSGQAGE